MSPWEAIEAIRAIVESNGASPDLPADKIEPILDQVDLRTYLGAAKAAFDQAYEDAAATRGYVVTPEFWVSRAQAAAAIASAEQAHVANLIAWKALQQQRASTPMGVEGLPFAGDAVAEEIEQLLGITS